MKEISAGLSALALIAGVVVGAVVVVMIVLSQTVMRPDAPPLLLKNALHPQDVCGPEGGIFVMRGLDDDRVVVLMPSRERIWVYDEHFVVSSLYDRVTGEFEGVLGLSGKVGFSSGGDALWIDTSIAGRFEKVDMVLGKPARHTLSLKSEAVAPTFLSDRGVLQSNALLQSNASFGGGQLIYAGGDLVLAVDLQARAVSLTKYVQGAQRMVRLTTCIDPVTLTFSCGEVMLSDGVVVPGYQGALEPRLEGVVVFTPSDAGVFFLDQQTPANSAFDSLFEPE